MRRCQSLLQADFGAVYARLSQAAAIDNCLMNASPARCAALSLVCVAIALLQGCGDEVPQLPWQDVQLQDAGLRAKFPCVPDVAQRKVDFGMEQGAVNVVMMGCDAVDSTYAVSHWLLDDVRQADDALAYWQAAVLTKLDAVDSDEGKSGAAFVPAGAMNLSRSIRASVQGIGPSGWTITTHGVWFAKQEGEQARIYHAVVYSPKPQHQIASQFFKALELQN